MKKNPNKKWKCPKCKQMVTDFPAISRDDNKTEICSNCGSLEALNVFTTSLKKNKIITRGGE